MSLFSAPQYYPRFPATPFPTFSNEIAPLFRLMDEFASSARSLDNWPQLQLQLQARPTVPFQPRFDVREVAGAYELRGELPGVESNALQVEFTDAHTLVIRGKTVTDKTSGTSPAPEAQASTTPAVTTEAEPTAVADNTDAASTHSASSYQKPTVEDEDGTQESSSTTAEPTPTSSPASETQQQVADTTVKASPTKASNETQAQQGKYWISERTTGSFQRVFTFPSRVNQEGVKASLKNGVLNIIVPKATAPISRRINVE